MIDIKVTVAEAIAIANTAPEAAENLLRDLAGLGCEGYLS